MNEKTHSTSQMRNVVERYGFDHIVSLGYNCEVSFRIQDYLQGSVESYPFTWAYILDQAFMGDILEKAWNADIVGKQWEVNGANMFVFSDNKISFHSKGHDEKVWDDSGKVIKDWEQKALSELKSRMNHLCEKFKMLSVSGDSVLFLMKIKSGTTQEMAEYIKQTASFLGNHFQKDKYFYVAVVEEETAIEELEKIFDSCDNMAIDSVKQFAPDSDTKDGGDLKGWKDILKYYNHAFDCVIPDRKHRLNRRNYLLDNEENEWKEKFFELKKWTDQLTEDRDWLADQLEQANRKLEEREKHSWNIFRGRRKK